MLRRLAVAVLVLITAAQALPAGSGLFPYLNCPRPSYSPLNYWAPSVYRVSAALTPPAHYTHVQADGCWPTHIVKFRCPAVEPFHRYLDTGLPYDPNGPFSPAPYIPSTDPPTKAIPYSNQK